MPKGNPNPSPETRFGGPRGNKPNGGKTSAQKKAEYEAAEKAALVADAMISSIKDKIDAGEDASEYIDASVLKLIKEVQDRAHGTPQQSVTVDSTQRIVSREPMTVEEWEQRFTHGD